jgi:ketohexokinase
MIWEDHGIMLIDRQGRIPDVTLKCITYVREHQPSAQISVEIEKPGREGLLELSHMANYVFFSRSWATHAGFTDIRTFLAAQGETHYRNRKTSGFAFCTWAEVGSGFCNLDSSISHQDRESSDLDSDLPEDFIHRVHVVEASLPKGKAAMDIVDTVGAGDVFIASVLGQVMSKGRTNSISSSEMQRIIRIANATCGHKICQEGFQTLPVFPES